MCLQLEELELSQNELGDAGLVGLLRTLRQPYVGNQLRYMGLARNSIGDRGAAALAEHLTSSGSPHLEHLELRDNGIDTQRGITADGWLG